MADNLFTGATNSLWIEPTNWSQGTVPTNSDGYITRFDGTSPACTISGGNQQCNHLDMTGYTNNISNSTGLTIKGDVTFSGSGGTISGNSTTFSQNATITSNGYVNTNIILFTGNKTYTLADKFVSNGSLTFTGAGQTFTLNGSDLEVNGVSSSNNITVQGTSKIIFKSGNSNNQTTTFYNDIDIDGNITFPATNRFKYGNGTLRYLSGSLSFHATSILTIISSCTLDLDGCIPIDLQVTTSDLTLTLASDLTISEEFTVSKNLVWAGSYNFQCHTFICTTNNTALTFVSGSTYTVTNSLTLTGSAGNLITFTASTPTSAYNFVLSGPATQNVSYVNSTDADSSAGQTIYDTPGGVLLRTVNWSTSPPSLSNSGFFLLFD